ncbi:MAG: trypsin-like peptidase domain-containing protein [Clostridia bacterium]|nr:trypsin-like peptidase domain-containing protein [Clostridia bacterium]
MEENKFGIDPEEGKEEEKAAEEEIMGSETEAERISEEPDAAPEEKTKEETYAFRWNYTEQDNANSEAARKKRKNGMKIYAIVMTAAFLICFALLAAVLIIDDFANITETKIIETERTIYVREYDSESGVLTISEIADKVKPSVVGIEITTVSGGGVGTGIIMSEDGYIATNAHVVEGAQSVTVIMLDGSEKEAEIVGRDTLSDLAVVKIEGEGYPAAEFGKSEELLVGELAVAIGTPGGLELAGTVTSGIISAINRNVKIFDETTGALQKTMTLIQTSASINKGNSGGPLINERGQVIGINTLKLADGYDGIGFAIPIDGALEILDKIIETGEDISENNTSIAQKRAIIGIKGGAVNQSSGAPIAGVYVSEIYEGYDAANHLKVGDIIVGIDGYEVLAIDDISAVIATKTAGDTVTLKVYRGGQLFDAEIILDYEK